MNKNKDYKAKKAPNIPIKIRIDEELFLDAKDIVEQRKLHTNFTDFITDAVKLYIDQNK